MKKLAFCLGVFALSCAFSTAAHLAWIMVKESNESTPKLSIPERKFLTDCIRHQTYSTCMGNLKQMQDIGAVP